MEEGKGREGGNLDGERVVSIPIHQKQAEADRSGLLGAS